ncbi:MAG: hypothetical protein QM622_04995 [Microbacterium sp.]
MTLRTRIALPTAVLVALTTGLVTGCASSAEPEPTETVTAQSPSAPASEPTPEPSDTETAVAIDPTSVTCENLVVEEVLAEFDAQGWTAESTPLTVGGQTLDVGLECSWADYEEPSGNLMIFGWGLLTAEQAEAASAQLVSEGWLREESDDGFYITEDPEQAPTLDENGYGMTYQFGDGWVIVSDVKEGLLLINRPGA